MYAAYYGHCDTVRQLLGYGASLHIRNHQGCSALMLAAVCGSEVAVEMLIKVSVTQLLSFTAHCCNLSLQVYFIQFKSQKFMCCACGSINFSENVTTWMKELPPLHIPLCLGPSLSWYVPLLYAFSFSVLFNFQVALATYQESWCLYLYLGQPKLAIWVPSTFWQLVLHRLHIYTVHQLILQPCNSPFSLCF